MRSFLKYSILSALVLCFHSGFSANQGNFVPEKIIKANSYVPFYDLIKSTEAEMIYDPVGRRGKIFLREHQAVFLEDCSVMIIDGHLSRAHYPVIRSNDEIMIPSDHFRNIIASFFPESSITKTDKGFSWGAVVPIPEEKIAKPKSKSVREEKIASAAAEKIGFIIIDAGHGGKDPGAVGKGTVYEKNITLAVAKQIGKVIKQNNPQLKVYFTRSTDVFVELGGRTEFANRKLTNELGGLFVSVHVNASIIPKMTGFETYFLSQNPTNEDARSTAALENNVVILENPGRRKSYDDVEYIEALMLTTQILKESSDLAEKIQSSLGKSIKDTPSRGVKTADFFVLRGSLMPAVLCEIGYITNDKERTRLTQKDYQDKIAQSIAQGIDKFLAASKSPR